MTTHRLPLAGVRIVEFAGIGPVPFAAMLLADYGADVIQVDRLGRATSWLADPEYRDLVDRGRRRVAIDVKSADGRGLALELIERSDVLLEGYRPGTMERLGLGPEISLQRNPNLVYGRMTGWGQTGPLAQRAGHDIDYLAVTGALHAMGGPLDPPTPPLNLVADYGGGAMFLALGVMTALMAIRLNNASGQVVDAAMVDGASLLTTTFRSALGSGHWSRDRGANILDGGAPWYSVYRCADDGFIAIGALEPEFYSELIARTGFDDGRPEFGVAAQYNRRLWPEQRARWTRLFATRSRDAWVALLDPHDTCAAPVLDFDEAPAHAQLAARNTFISLAGVQVPAPAPRFSDTPLQPPLLPTAPGSATDQVLRELGLDPDRIEQLRASNVIA